MFLTMEENVLSAKQIREDIQPRMTVRNENPNDNDKRRTMTRRRRKNPN
jgi:hypothetical protein